MAQTESAISDSRQTSPHWPELLSKTICDLSLLAHTEFELHEAGLKRVIEGQIDRMSILALLTAIFMYGLLLLVGGLVLLIHLWLDWWLALLIMGTAAIVAGLALRWAMAPRHEAGTHQSVEPRRGLADGTQARS
jgi:hypothetical protein